MKYVRAVNKAQGPHRSLMIDRADGIFSKVAGKVVERRGSIEMARGKEPRAPVHLEGARWPYPRQTARPGAGIWFEGCGQGC